MIACPQSGSRKRIGQGSMVFKAFLHREAIAVKRRTCSRQDLDLRAFYFAADDLRCQQGRPGDRAHRVGQEDAHWGG